MMKFFPVGNSDAKIKITCCTAGLNPKAIIHHEVARCGADHEKGDVA